MISPFKGEVKGKAGCRKGVRMKECRYDQEKNHLQWMRSYSIVFLAACLCVYALYIYDQRSLIFYTKNQVGDGLQQHYTTLMYYGRWLRDILHRVFIEHQLSIPDWDLSIGLGGDVIATLHYYGLGDPWNLLAVFVPEQYTEQLYEGLVVLRMYLAGAAFGIYCRHHGYQNAMILPGVLIYVFSFYTIVVSVLHPFFLNPLIYFPFILLGIDLVMEEGKPVVFILSCIVAAYSSFYFFYMLSILMFIYAVIRYLMLFRTSWSGKHLLIMIGKFVCWYLGAVLAALPVLLPSAIEVLSGERVGDGAQVPVFYEPAYYAKLPIAFVNASADHYAALGYTSVGLLAVAMLFGRTERGKKLHLKVAFVLGTVFLMIPFCGHVLNGFGYATNRWVWAYCFVVSLIVVDQMPQMVEHAEKSVMAAALGMLSFALPTLWFRAAGDKKKLALSAILLLCTGAGMTVLLLLGNWRKEGRMSSRVFQGLVLINIFLNAFSFYAPFGGNDIENHAKAGTIYRERMNGFYGIFDEEGMDTSRVRIDTAHMGFSGAKLNAAMLYGKNGTSFYFSTNNNVTSSFIRDMELPVSTDICYVDLDARSMLDALLGCRYCVVRQGEEQYLPYGYDKEVVSRDGYGVYEGRFVFPLVYTYDSYIGREDYDGLTAAQKQQALLQVCVLEEDADDVARKKPEWLEFTDTQKEVSIDACSEGVEVKDKRIVVSKEGGWVHISADAAEDTERYLKIRNLWYRGCDIADITVSDGKDERSFQVRSTWSTLYSDIHNIMCNLGYRHRHGDGYTVRFGQTGTYTFDSMEIVDQPMHMLEQMVEKRTQDQIRYVAEGDEIRLDVKLDDPGIVYTAVPYGRKWKASVDGEKAECRKANGFGIGIYVEAGEHHIELRY